MLFFFFSSRRRHTRLVSDWSSDVCSSDLGFICALAIALISTSVPKTISEYAENFMTFLLEVEILFVTAGFARRTPHRALLVQSEAESQTRHGARKKMWRLAGRGRGGGCKLLSGV